MSKKIKIIIVVIIVLILIILNIKNILNLKDRIDILEERTAGMTITMLGGSNMEDKGNVNSCGFVVRSTNEELIIVDGGRDIDYDLVLEYIKRFGNGKVNHWFITHAHSDHVGALITLLEKEDIIIENIYYSLNSLEWYRENDKRGFESEEKMIKQLGNSKIKNKIECQKNQIIKIDNIECEIIRIANPEITNSDNGNDSSMVFKFTATDVNKSIIFLGDAYTYASIELMEKPEKLKADAVQMSHHGQYGVTEEVYNAINPEICFFNAPRWLYDNNLNGQGYNTGKWQSVIVREWLSEMETTNFLAADGDRTIRFTKKGIEY